MLNAIITNIQLHWYKIKDNNYCTFCEKEQETILHLFYSCPHVQRLWTYVKSLHSNFNDLDAQAVLFNTVRSNPKFVENCITLIAKFYIYNSRCMKQELSIYALKQAIIEYRDIEKSIASKNQKLDKHAQKWQDITCKNSHYL